MEIFNRKQMLKNDFIAFVKNTKNENTIYSVQTDIKKGYWVKNGIIYNNNIFNLNAATKVLSNNLSKNTVYYVSTIPENQRQLF